MSSKFFTVKTDDAPDVAHVYDHTYRFNREHSRLWILDDDDRWQEMELVPKQAESRHDKLVRRAKKAFEFGLDITRSELARKLRIDEKQADLIIKELLADEFIERCMHAVTFVIKR